MNPIFSLIVDHGVAAVWTLAVWAVGFVIGRRVQNKHDLAIKRDEARDARLHLHQENQHNLGRLKVYMRGVEQGLQGTYDAEHIEWRLRVDESDLPVWSHDFRTRLIPHQRPALTESELSRLFDLHAGLDRLTALRAKLQQVFTDDMRAVAIRCRKEPEFERVGSLPVTPGGHAYQEARAFATKIREFNRATQDIRAEWQGIWNQLSSMMDLLAGDIPPLPPQPPTLADHLRRLPKVIADWLPFQVTWRRKAATTTTGEE
jgi:hypothetical protein